MSDSGTALLIHTGELAEYRPLLESLGARCVERRPGQPPPAEELHLVVAAGNHFVGLDLSKNGSTAVRIAVLTSDSRTLRSELKRLTIDYVLRPPVHPAALRLLLLHSLYRGPERRRQKRVSVGAPVRFRSGLRRRSGLLADLSLGGCRIFVDQPIETGEGVRIQFPESLGGSGFSLKGKIVRVLETGAEQAHAYAMSVRFGKPSAAQKKQLTRAIESCARGPATLEAGDSMPVSAPETALASLHEAGAEVAAVAEPSRGSPTEEFRPLPPVYRPDPPPPVSGPALVFEIGQPTDDLELETDPDALDIESDLALPQLAAEDHSDDLDMRSTERRKFSDRVISMGSEANEVLIGRDISEGGIRVDPSEGLDLGATVRLALYVDEAADPLVVDARVQRDDGADGVALRFVSPPDDVTAQLRSMVASLPPLSCDGESHAIVVNRLAS